MKDIYKCYQMMEFFVAKYGYTNLYVQGLTSEEQIWLINLKNPNYQLIRIALKPIDDNDEIVNTFIKMVQEKKAKENINFLNIVISFNESFNQQFDTAVFEADFHSGVDLNAKYPGILNCVHNVENEENELSRLLTNINVVLKQQRRLLLNKPLFERYKSCNFKVSLIVCLICVIMFIAFARLKLTYSESASLIFLGADYKIFTLGLKEFWRLLSAGFLHASLMHLLCNCVSIIMLGNILEPRIGKLKFSFILFTGVLVGNLTHGVFCDNTLNCGLSGGVYALFVFFILYFMKSTVFNIRNFMPTIFINLYLNFMPNVSWQAHLGGALAGAIFYFIYKENKVNYSVLPVIFIMIFGLFFKYYSDYTITPFYKGTDNEVIKISNNLGLKKYATKLKNNLIIVYKEGLK